MRHEHSDDGRKAHLLDIIQQITHGRAYSQAAFSWHILGVALWRTCGDGRAVPRWRTNPQYTRSDPIA
ncbi:MAG TPA: hypothetical protein VKC66_32980 [Xanthobacteraceae bacterium]|nr:hypothetical protein [Xanthobacteraceae bacterium]